MLINHQLGAGHVVLIAQESRVLIRILDDAYNVAVRIYATDVSVVAV
jgi:hypothetical protein